MSKKRTMKWAELSASGLYRAEQCPASFAIPLPHREGSKGPDEPPGLGGASDGGTKADRGTYIHAVLEWRLRGATLPEALVKGQEKLTAVRARRGDPKAARKAHHAWVARASSHDPREILPPGYAWVPEHRWGAEFGGLQIDGTPDAVGIRGSMGYVVDWKTTEEPKDNSHLPAEWILRRERYLAFRAKAHKLQALYHALVFLEKMPQVTEVTTDVVYLGPRGQQWGSHSDTVVRNTDSSAAVKMRLYKISKKVQAARAAEDTEEHARAGDACDYCPARGYCSRALAAGVRLFLLACLDTVEARARLTGVRETNKMITKLEVRTGLVAHPPKQAVPVSAGFLSDTMCSVPGQGVASRTDLRALLDRTRSSRPGIHLIDAVFRTALEMGASHDEATHFMDRARADYLQAKSVLQYARPAPEPWNTPRQYSEDEVVCGVVALMALQARLNARL